MTVEEALEFVESLLHSQSIRPLNDVQRAVFRGSWSGQTYERLYEQEQLAEHCSIEHLERNVGPDLWRLLATVLSERVSKKGLQGAVERAKKRPPVANSASEQTPALLPPEVIDPSPRSPESWSNAPDTSNFHGREQALETVKHWITLDGCRLVLLYGIKGIGKTLFATKLAQEVQPQFEFVVWRSLSNWHSSNQSPTTKQLLADLLSLLLDLPAQKAHLADLLRYLQQHRCLIVLDGLEAVLSSVPPAKAFSELLENLGNVPHQSCLLLTSQEEPQEIARMKGDQTLIRALRLQGLGELAAREMLLTKGNLAGSERDWCRLVRNYEGHPLLLKAVTGTILTLCNGSIANFLEQFEQICTDEVRHLLQPSMSRLTEAERSICHYLYQRGEPTTSVEILTGLGSRLKSAKYPLQEITKALETLDRKSLAYGSDCYYSLQPLVEQYLAQNQVA